MNKKQRHIYRLEVERDDHIWRIRHANDRVAKATSDAEYYSNELEKINNEIAVAENGDDEHGKN